MSVAGLVSESVVYYDFVSVTGELDLGLFHDPVADCIDGAAPLHRKVNALVEFAPAPNGIDAIAETAGNVIVARARQYRWHGWYARNQIARPLCDEVDLVERLALDVGTARDVRNPGKHGEELRGRALGGEAVIQFSIYCSCLEFRRYGAHTVNRAVNAVVAVFDSDKRVFVGVELAAEQFAPALPLRIALFEHRRLWQVESEHRDIEPRIKGNHQRGCCKHQERPEQDMRDAPCHRLKESL